VSELLSNIVVGWWFLDVDNFVLSGKGLDCLYLSV
jgi:hypothetical protein